MRISYRLGGSWLYLAALIACLAHSVYAQSANGQSMAAEQRGLPRNDSSTSNAEFAQNAKRVALVIGNAAYKQGRLSNPVNDARAIASRLRGLGFEVVFYENLKTRDIGGMYREFRSKISPGGVALVFYAGHGLQFKGQNYFPAVDSEINGEEDVPLQSVNLGTLLDMMEEAKAAVSLVFLDACRDNPFARRFRSVSSGLAKIEVASGTLIHYATKPGSVASDGDNANGTYTEALLAQMGEPGVPVELMLKRVANRVVSKTRGRQEPWMEGSLRGDFYFIFKGPVTVQLQPAPDVDPENQTWSAALRANSPSAYQAYLDAFPQGRFAVAAKIAYDSLRQATTPSVGTTSRASSPPSPQPAPLVDDAETALWNAVEASNTSEDYGVYLKQYPKGKYAASAQQRQKKLDSDAKANAERAKKLNAEALIQADAQAWERARGTNTVDAYNDYLSLYASGRFAALAQTAQKRLQRDAKNRPQPEPARAERELPKVAEPKRARVEPPAAVRRGDMIGLLQIKDGWTGVTSNSMDVRVAQANAERTVYSTGDVVTRDGAVQQLRVGNVVLQVISGALWTVPIMASASGSAKVQLGSDATLQGTIKWNAVPGAGGKGQVNADIQYLSNANSANHPVIVLGKWSATYDAKHALPESDVTKLRGGASGLVTTEITNMSTASFEWAEAAYNGNTGSVATRTAAANLRDVAGTLLLKDGFTGVVNSSLDVRVQRATAQETIYSTGDVVGVDGSVLKLRVGNIVLQVVSGALWTIPIHANASGTANVQVGSDATMRGTIKWTTTKMDSGKSQVNADIEYLSNANGANRAVIVQGKWSAVYNGTLPLPESDVTKLRGGAGGLISTEITNMFTSILELH